MPVGERGRERLKRRQKQRKRERRRESVQISEFFCSTSTQLVSSKEERGGGGVTIATHFVMGLAFSLAP